MQPEARKLDAGEWVEFLAPDWRLVDDTPQRAVVLQNNNSKDPAGSCRNSKTHYDTGSVDNARQRWQERRQLLLHLFAVEFGVSVFEAVV